MTSAASEATDSGRVVIVGGGLAGMTIARELAQRGLRTLVLEASERLGGKAGANRVGDDWLDHGYHVFPGWYLNTRRLLRELRIEDRLHDVNQVHYLRAGAFPRFHTLRSIDSLASAWHNLFSGLVPWHDAVLAAFFALDLASARIQRASFLDLVSANGYLRSRPYRTESVAKTHHHFVLQAASVPNYEISAMTAKRITAAWFKVRTPIFSILDGDLQRRFIDPFAQSLEKLAVEVWLETRVSRLRLERGRVTALELGPEREPLALGPRDLVVLTTPHQITHGFVDDAVHEAECAAPPNLDEKLLSELCHLRSAPMAAVHVFFKRRITGIPREHVVLVDSPHELSFVDVSQHWEGRETTLLSCIASDFGPLARCSDEIVKFVLVNELLDWLKGAATLADVDMERTQVFPNTSVPLFLNTVGAWSYRPNTKTRLDNLYVAGDWCRAEVDLTTIEGAIVSALNTAGAIWRRLGRAGPPIEAIPYPHLPEILLRLLYYAGLPGATALGLLLRLREWRQTEP